MPAKRPRYTLIEAFNIAGNRLHSDWTGFGKPDFLVEARAKYWPKPRSHINDKKKSDQVEIPEERLEEWQDAGWDEEAAKKRQISTEKFIRGLMACYRIEAWLTMSQSTRDIAPEDWLIDRETHIWLNFDSGLAGYQNDHSGMSGPEGFLEISREEFDKAIDDRLGPIEDPRVKGGRARKYKKGVQEFIN
jgi:hypothetical protein